MCGRRTWYWGKGSYSLLFCGLSLTVPGISHATAMHVGICEASRMHCHDNEQLQNITWHITWEQYVGTNMQSSFLYLFAHLSFYFQNWMFARVLINFKQNDFYKKTINNFEFWKISFYSKTSEFSMDKSYQSKIKINSKNKRLNKLKTFFCAICAKFLRYFAEVREHWRHWTDFIYFLKIH